MHILISTSFKYDSQIYNDFMQSENIYLILNISLKRVPSKESEGNFPQNMIFWLTNYWKPTFNSVE